MPIAYGFTARRLLTEEDGQVVLPWALVLVIGFFGMMGLVTDVGRAFVARSQLQNAANSAALAAAGRIYSSQSSNDAYHVAVNYSASSGDQNALTVGSVTTSVYTGCVSFLLPSGTTCKATTVKNAVQVVESTAIRNYFMPIFLGSNTTNISVAATAATQGTASGGFNVAIIVDATASMVNTTDSNCSTGPASRFNCALTAIQGMLGKMRPCDGSGSACTPDNSSFRVSLFAFPNVTTATRPDNYGCSGAIPTHEHYTLPRAGLSGYANLTYNGHESTYQVTLPNTGNADAYGFVSDYYSTSTKNSLDPGSELVKAIGGAAGCAPMNSQGGESTYYAGILYAAQNALTAAKAQYPSSQNVLILLSDGEAQAPSSSFPPSGSTPSPSSAGYAVVTNSSSNHSTNLAGSALGSYPDWHDQCQQAIVAGQAATAAGTRVIAIAYGAEKSGCTASGGGYDSTLVATGKNVAFTLSNLGPCETMENIASSMDTDFFSDYTQSGTDSTCQATGTKAVHLSDDMLAIAASFTSPRLLPNDLFLFGVSGTQ